MFSRSGFYFTKNSTVLTSLARHPSCKPNLILNKINSPTLKQFKFNQLYKLFRPKRSYTTIASSSSPITTNLKSKVSTNLNPSSNLITPPKSVGIWLIGTSTLIFGIVVLGGLTRLTESGLSITEWKPVTGSIPPLNEKDWEEEFNKYKNSPEFKQLNSHLTLEEFKFIFLMEWSHRLVGRFIGLVFIIPAIIFWSRNKFNPRVTKRVIGLTGLLGLQGFIGWWMVKSGLDEEELKDRRSKPTVSQYRLTTHLGAAFLMYLGVLYTAMEILQENKIIKTIKKGGELQFLKIEKLINQLNNPALIKLRYVSYGLLALTFLTAMSGGMVAGLDAGLIYNTFPHMGDNWIPSKNELMDPVYSRNSNESDLWWRNLLENPTTVQLIHRIMATTTFFSILVTHVYCNRRKNIVPRQADIMMKTMMGFLTLQVTLGITTLIYLVPIPLAAAHQAGALALLTTALAFVSRLRKPRPEFVSYINKLMKNQLLKSKRIV
ncbi:COX15 [Candida pseudojiufengensis]|uniref:COX15 n=1 Tax=Candida pseudojiufengensis TaxID=497109 RepID=UPI002224DC4A|nr:COX15 [Candida pseudojiufengensis]KAI5963008.1 COX15 [Candida pseudojiufengensis]